MTKNFGYYVILILCIGILLSLACERHTSQNALQIVSINQGRDLNVDIADWARLPDPEDPEDTILVALMHDYAIPVQVRYVEVGLGLPTYPTPYTARITDYKVTFRHQSKPQWTFTAVNGATNMVIPADPNGRSSVTNNLTVIPGVWLRSNFNDSLEGREPNTLWCGVLKATLILSGYEELTQEPITDTAYFSINISDSYDDPTRVDN
ncbi:MAG: hypothetical protein ABIK31_03980 [candidate division WOR-3 bacterium]